MIDEHPTIEFPSARLRGLQARMEAQKIAFGPVVFQCLRSAWKSGLLALIEKTGEAGASVDELVPEQVGDAEAVMTRPLLRQRHLEVVVVLARHLDPLAAGVVFQPHQRVAVVAHLHRQPVGIELEVAVVLEVIRDRPRQRRADELPVDRHDASHQIGDLREGLAAQVEVAGRAFRAAVDDAHHDTALRPVDPHRGAAPVGLAILHRVHRRDQALARVGIEAAGRRAGGVVMGGDALLRLGRGLGAGLQGREQQGQAERDPGQRRKTPRVSFVGGCEADSRSKDRL